MRRKGYSTDSLKQRAGFCFELPFQIFFLGFLFLWLDGLLMTIYGLMVMLEMVLDELSYRAFMEQDTNFLSYELRLFTESGKI